MLVMICSYFALYNIIIIAIFVALSLPFSFPFHQCAAAATAAEANNNNNNNLALVSKDVINVNPLDLPSVGSLYDAEQDKFIGGGFPFPLTDVGAEHPDLKAKVISTGRYADESDMLKLSGEVKVKFLFMSGTIGASYHHVGTANSLDVTTVIEIRSIKRKQTVDNIKLLRDGSYAKILLDQAKKGATHMVSEVTLGGNAYLAVRVRASNSSHAKELSGLLSGGVSLGFISGEAKFEVDHKARKAMAEHEVRVEVSGHLPPEVLENIKVQIRSVDDIQHNLNTLARGLKTSATVVAYKLTPITTFVTPESRMIESVDQALLDAVDRAASACQLTIQELEGFSVEHSTALDSRLLDIYRNFNLLKASTQTGCKTLMQAVLEMLPRIRSGSRADSDALGRLVRNFDVENGFLAQPMAGLSILRAQADYVNSAVLASAGGSKELLNTNRECDASPNVAFNLACASDDSIASLAAVHTVSDTAYSNALRAVSIDGQKHAITVPSFPVVSVPMCDAAPARVFAALRDHNMEKNHGLSFCFISDPTLKPHALYFRTPGNAQAISQMPLTLPVALPVALFDSNRRCISWLQEPDVSDRSIHVRQPSDNARAPAELNTKSRKVGVETDEELDRQWSVLCASEMTPDVTVSRDFYKNNNVKHVRRGGIVLELPFSVESVGCGHCAHGAVVDFEKPEAVALLAHDYHASLHMQGVKMSNGVNSKGWKFEPTAFMSGLRESDDYVAHVRAMLKNRQNFGTVRVRVYRFAEKEFPGSVRHVWKQSSDTWVGAHSKLTQLDAKWLCNSFDEVRGVQLIGHLPNSGKHSEHPSQYFTSAKKNPITKQWQWTGGPREFDPTPVEDNWCPEQPDNAWNDESIGISWNLEGRRCLNDFSPGMSSAIEHQVCEQSPVRIVRDVTISDKDNNK